MGFKIVAITGSVQAKAKTRAALDIVLDEVTKRTDIEVDLIDPGTINLPLPGQNGDEGAIQELQDRVASATGVVLGTPEYHGSYSSVIKLVIDNLGYPSVLAGKPIGLLGVAAGEIGAIKALEHLRSVCSHVGALVLPGPVSIPSVHLMFDESGNCTDERMENRIRRLAETMTNYIEDHICPKITLEDMVRRNEQQGGA
ncbi:MAG: NAD(P)H-dependent oxidoreductase [Planctomycetota bacterium]